MDLRDDAEALAAIYRFEHSQLLGAVERADPVAEVPGALAVFTPSFPLVWELNAIVAPEGADRAQLERLVELSDPIQGGAGLHHRKLRQAGRGSLEDLSAVAGEAGWILDHEVAMVRRRDSDREPAARATIREISPAEQEPAADEFLRAEPYGQDAEARRQVGAQYERWDLAMPIARCLGIVEDGRVVAWCRLYGDDRILEVDEVSVVPSKRGRGLGRALLEALMAEVPAGPMLFLCADVHDWPRRLYGRLGFDAVGELLGATRPADPQP